MKKYSLLCLDDRKFAPVPAMDKEPRKAQYLFFTESLG